MPDALNLRLVMLYSRLLSGARRRAAPEANIRVAARSEDEPELRSAYLLSLSVVWSSLVGVVGIGVFTPLFVILQHTGAGHREIALRAFIGVSVAILLGSVDAFWRLALVNHVRNNHLEGVPLTDRRRRVMRASLVRIPTLLIQVLVAVGVALIAR